MAPSTPMTSHRDEHLALCAQDRRRCASYDWPGSSCGPEMPVGPTRRRPSALELAIDLDHLMTLCRHHVRGDHRGRIRDLARLAELLADAERLWKRLPMPYLMIVGEALQAGWTSARDRPGALRRSCDQWRARVPMGRLSTSPTHSSSRPGSCHGRRVQPKTSRRTRGALVVTPPQPALSRGRAVASRW